MDSCYEPDSYGIPIDLFVSKKNPRHRIITSHGFTLRFTDSSANLLFSLHPPSSSSSSTKRRLLADSSGNPLISIAHKQAMPDVNYDLKKSGPDKPVAIIVVYLWNKTMSRWDILSHSRDLNHYVKTLWKGTWQGFRKDSSEEKDVMFKIERTMNTLTRLEFQVFLSDGDPNKSDFKMRGSPFYRSCTIYNGDSIVAQTSLMYKLGMQKVVVPRNRFRLTIFPGGYADHALIVALTAIFFDGRKLWI